MNKVEEIQALSDRVFEIAEKDPHEALVIATGLAATIAVCTGVSKDKMLFVLLALMSEAEQALAQRSTETLQ